MIDSRTSRHAHTNRIGPVRRFGAGLVLACTFQLTHASAAAPVTAATPDGLRARLARASVPFVPNAGQWAPGLAFAAQTLGGTLLVERDGGLLYSLPGLPESRAGDAAPGAAARAHAARGGGWVLRETLLGDDGLSAVAAPRGERPAATRVSLFTGSGTQRRPADLATYERVALGEVYPGIGMTLRATGTNVEKIFTVAPGGDPARIRVKVDGATTLEVGPGGELVVHTGNGPVAWTAPIAYQLDAQGGHEAVAVRYALDVRRAEYGFALGAYDPALPVIIDPLLQSTYLGAGFYDWGGRIAVHPANGEIYVSGYTGIPSLGTTENAGFPGVAHGAQPSPGGDYDVFISRFSPDLKTLLQSTFLGTTGPEYAMALAIHPLSGDVYVSGYTGAAGGTLPGVSGGAQGSPAGGQDVFVGRFSADLRTLVQSTYFGGTGQDIAAALAIHPVTGDIYVAGSTDGTLPGTAGATRPAPGSTVAYVARFAADLKSVVRATYVGPSSLYSSAALAIHPATGEVYVAGSTDAPGSTFPGTSGAAQSAYGGGSGDAFVARLSADLGTLVRATYLGGNGTDTAAALAIHPASGDVYVIGSTDSASLFPGTPGGMQPALGGQRDAFVARLTRDLGTVVRSTYLGGSDFDTGYAIAIDAASGDVYVAGDTSSAAFPGRNGGAQSSLVGSRNAFVSRLAPDLTQLVQSSYLGGPGDGWATGIAIHPASGEVYLTGVVTLPSGTNPALPGTAGGAQSQFGGGYADTFVSRLTADLRLQAADGYQYASQFGSTGSAPGQLKGPLGVAIDAAGNRVLIADTGNDRIQIFTLDGAYVGQFGAGGSGDGQFTSPAAVAVDPVSREILVADYGNKRIQVFDAAGAFQRKFGAPGSGNGQFNGPIDVAVDPRTRNIIVAEYTRVQIFDRNGQYLTQFADAFGYTQPGTYRGVAGIAVDPVSGGIVVGDGGVRLHFTDASGTGQLELFGGNSSFIATGRVAIDPVSHRVYMADLTYSDGISLVIPHDLVHVFDAGGQWLFQVGGTGTGIGQLKNPAGIAVDPVSHRFYVADSGNNRIQVFRPLGAAQNGNAFLTGMALSRGALDRPFEPAAFSLSALLANAASEFTITPMTSDAAASVKVNGVAVASGAASAAIPAAVGANNVSVEVTAPDGTTKVNYSLAVARESSPPALRYRYRAQFGGAGSADGQMSGPSGVAIDPVTRNLIVADTRNDRIQVHAPDGSLLAQFGGSGTADGRLSGPVGVAVDPQTRDIVVADAGNKRVQVFTAVGTFKARIGAAGTADGQFDTPSGVAIDPATREIVVADAGQNRVQVFTAAGAFARKFGAAGNGNGQFRTPQGVAVDPANGNVVVVDSGNDRVQIFDRAGAFQKAFGGRGTSEGQFVRPQGVAIDPLTRNILVADTGIVELLVHFYSSAFNQRIQIFSPDGMPIGKFGAHGAAAGQFRYPWGVAIDPVSHHLYVGDTSNDRVQLFIPTSPFVTGNVVEFYNPDLDNYFITADPGEQAFVDSGAVGRWQRTGTTFNAGGPESVCRFYGNGNVNPATGAPWGPNSHFYSIAGDECTGLIALYTPDAKSWKFESYDFATTRPIETPPPARCAEGLVPVYRAYNNGFARGVDSNHRIASDLAAYQRTVAAGWVGEGVVMCAASESPRYSTTGSWTAPDASGSGFFNDTAGHCYYRTDVSTLRLTATIAADGIVTAATLAGSQSDGPSGSNSGCPAAPGTRPIAFTYKPGSGLVAGAKISFDLEGAAGNSPPSDASFSGSIFEGSMHGTLTIRRTDKTTGNEAWTITTVVQ